MATNFARILSLLVITLLTSVVSAIVPASSVPATQALRDAEMLASLRPDWQVYQAAGDSMEPFFGGNSLLLVQTARVESLQPGMIAVYRDAEGDLVGHQVVQAGAEVVAKGANNTDRDPATITEANLVGVVVGMLHAADPVASSLPTVHGKRY